MFATLTLKLILVYIVVCTRSTDHHHSVRNAWNRRSLCGHCRVILPTYLPTYLPLGHPQIYQVLSECQSSWVSFSASVKIVTTSGHFTESIRDTARSFGIGSLSHAFFHRCLF